MWQERGRVLGQLHLQQERPAPQGKMDEQAVKAHCYKSVWGGFDLLDSKSPLYVGATEGQILGGRAFMKTSPGPAMWLRDVRAEG